MREIASMEQLRASFLRWAMVTVPLVLLLGFASARIVPTGSENAWFAALAKPALLPPDWVFPVTWTVLYVLMGLALAMIVNARGSRYRGLALLLFVAQLAANLAWSPLFFGAHRIALALATIAALFVLATATTIAFGRVRALAAWLMVPYLAWIGFAGMVLWDVYRLNPDADALVPAASSTQIAL